MFDLNKLFLDSHNLFSFNWQNFKIKLLISWPVLYQGDRDPRSKDLLRYRHIWIIILVLPIPDVSTYCTQGDEVNVTSEGGEPQERTQATGWCWAGLELGPGLLSNSTAHRCGAMTIQTQNTYIFIFTLDVNHKVRPLAWRREIKKSSTEKLNFIFVILFRLTSDWSHH